MLSYPFYLAFLSVHFDSQEKDFNALRCSVLAVCTDYGVECLGLMIGSSDANAKSTGRIISEFQKNENGTSGPMGPWDVTYV